MQVGNQGDGHQGEMVRCRAAHAFTCSAHKRQRHNGDDVDIAAKGPGDNRPELSNITDMADRNARWALPARG